MNNESPKIIEKIAFLINWPRELDMIRPLLKELNDDEFDIVMNDASGRDLLALKSIESFIENKNNSDNIVRLSDINKISEYMSVVSTGLGPIRVITIRSTVLYIYAHLIGRFFSTRFMKKILGIGVARKLMSGGRYRDLKGELYIERDIARNRICFPAELDKNISGYPNKKWRKVFDTFFSISSFDKKLLEIVACPVCKGKLVYDKAIQQLICKGERLAYPINEGIPVLLENKAQSWQES